MSHVNFNPPLRGGAQSPHLMKRWCYLLVIVLASCGHPRHEEPVPVSGTTPSDRPLFVEDSSSRNSLLRSIEPCVARARVTYPEARRRYLAGLSSGQTFFITVRLKDPDGRFEQVFVVVDQIQDTMLTGRIWNELRTVR